MSHPGFTPAEGHCTCGTVRYRMEAPPLIVHCCHCTWCQRETGSAFALNALVETSRVSVLAGEGALEAIDMPSASGKGQRTTRCGKCKIALWGHYGLSSPGISFVRVGTLEDAARFPPDIHVYTSTKLPWVVIPAGVPSEPAFYKPAEIWSEETRARFRASRG